MTRPLVLSVGIALLAGAVALGGWERVPSRDQRARHIVRPAPAAISAHVRRHTLESSRRGGARDEADSDGAPMPSGLHVHPDPAIRLYALEVWAFDPGERLDPVTHALVDPDESVRARAQELLEEALSRRLEMAPSG